MLHARSRRAAPLLAAVAALAAAPAARAHETLHAVERNRALAVKASLAGGEALADAPYQVYAPSDPSRPHQVGRTDRGGWLAFVPDAPGTWRVKVVDRGGHGFEVEVDADGPAAPAPGAASAATTLFRPLAGLAAIGAVFAVLAAVQRRRGARFP